MEPIITRHRFETRRRHLTVRHIERTTPNMIRVTLGGPDLEGFTSLAPDDHIKLFFPTSEGPVGRDYTPRCFDADSLVLDFAVHAAGPATAWALSAQPGDVLEIGGPRGSAVVAPVFDWWLLVGDETALPAIGRWIEEMPAGTRVTSLVAVTSGSEEQAINSQADHRALWVHRPEDQSADPAPLLAALRDLDLPQGRGFVWIAAEAGAASALREYMVGERGHPLTWLKSSGYWQQNGA